MVEERQGRGLVLWGVGTPRTLRAHWAMAELGLAYETRPVTTRSAETRGAAFTALTARQKIPVLQDGSLVLTESAAIVVYLSDAHGAPESALVPTDAAGRSRCLELCFLAVAELDGAALYVIRRHGHLPATYGEAPAAVTAARDYFAAQMRSVDRLLADGRPFILGDRLSAADIMLATCLDWAAREGLDLHPGAVGYLLALRRRGAFQAALARNRFPEPAPVRA